MSLSKEIIQVLERMVKKFQEAYNIEMYFCEVMGNRWSFIAGDTHGYLAQRREIITKNLGVMIDDSSVTDKDIENVVKIIRKELDE